MHKPVASNTEVEPFVKVPKWFFQCMKVLTPAEGFVLLAIIDGTIGWHVASKNISFDMLAKTTGMSKSSCQRAVRVLAKDNIIKKVYATYNGKKINQYELVHFSKWKRELYKPVDKRYITVDNSNNSVDNLKQ